MQVDIGFFNEGFVSFGCIIKNHGKNIILVGTRRENINVEPVAAELLTVRWSIRIAQYLKLSGWLFNRIPRLLWIVSIHL